MAGTGVKDYPEGAAPVDVLLIERAVKGRVKLLSDPDIVAFQQSVTKDQHYAASQSALRDIEARYLIQR